MDDNEKHVRNEGQDNSRVFKGLMHKIKAGSEVLADTAGSGRHRIDRLSIKRDLDKLYWKLGKEVVALVNAGEVVHPGLEERVYRIKRLSERLSKGQAD